MMKFTAHAYYAERTLTCETCDMDALMEFLNEREKDNPFYRTETTHSQTLNDGALNGYNGISTFTSSANVKVTEFMRLMGYGSKNTYNRYCFEESSPVSNLFLNLKYMLERDGEVESNRYFDPIFASNDVYLLENNAYLPLGFLAQPELGDLIFSGSNHFSLQNALFSAATGLYADVWHPMDAEITGENLTITYTGAPTVKYSDAQSGAVMTYSFTAQREGFVCIDFDVTDRNSYTVHHNGEKLYSKEVISNVIPHNVFNMSQLDKIPEQNLKLANAREFGISVATIYLGLDCTAEELGMEDYTIFIMGHQNPRVQYNTRAEDGLYIVNCLNNVVPESSPEGTCTLFFTMPIFGHDVPKDLKPQDYKKYKNALAKKYIEDAEKVLGISIMPHIEEISVATPVTFARYLGTPEGTIYGYKLSGWDNLMARIAGEKADYAIPGLNFCGGHYIRGDGYSCAYIMGDTVAKKVVKRLKGGA